MRCDIVGRQDGSPSRPSSSGGPDGPGFNQPLHQSPYPPQQTPQSYGGHTTGLSYSASTSSSYNNATASWKKQQTGVMGLAKDTVDKIAGKGTRKNVQASVQSACFLLARFCFVFFREMGGAGRGMEWARAHFPTPIGPSPTSLHFCLAALRPTVSSFFFDPFETPGYIVGLTNEKTLLNRAPSRCTETLHEMKRLGVPLCWTWLGSISVLFLW